MVRIVAEIGQNHQGDIKIARRLIDVAASPIYDGGDELPGVDIVKFCMRNREDIMNEPSFDRHYDNPNSFGKTYRDHRMALEFSPDQYKELKDYAESKGLEWLASCCDQASVSSVVGFGCDKVKIASRDLTNKNLREYIKNTDLDVWMSCGMSKPDEITRASYAWGNRLKVIFICTSQYPTSYENVKLDQIEDFRYLAPEIGWSDHTVGIVAPVVAMALGCTVIEKHITLSRSMKGTDHAGSLEPNGLWRMVRDIRNIEKALKDKPMFLPAEMPARNKLRTLERRG